jgi:hypothetical protein
VTFISPGIQFAVQAECPIRGCHLFRFLAQQGAFPGSRVRVISINALGCIVFYRLYIQLPFNLLCRLFDVARQGDLEALCLITP